MGWSPVSLARAQASHEEVHGNRSRVAEVWRNGQNGAGDGAAASLPPCSTPSPPRTRGAGRCSPGRPSRRGAPRSTRSTSSPSRTATPAPTSTSPSTPPSTRCAPSTSRPGILGARHPGAGVRRALAGAAADGAGQLRGHPQPARARLRRGGRRARRPPRPTPPSSPTASRGRAPRAYASVARPAEGTILTVADAAAAAPAQRRVERRARSRSSRPPSTPRPRRCAPPPTSSRPSRSAGVVDAGGAGYLLLLEALARVVHQDGAHVGDRMAPFAEDPTLRRREEWSQRGRRGRADRAHRAARPTARATCGRADRPTR